MIAGIEKQKNIPRKLLFPNVDAIFELPGRLNVRFFNVFITESFNLFGYEFILDTFPEVTFSPHTMKPIDEVSR